MVTTGAELASPVAVRLRRPSWRDPRLLAGLVMVAGAVALGAWAVSSAEASTPVYVARGTLTPGESVTGELVVAQVRLAPAQAAHYLSVTARAPHGLIVLRTVAKGELVPASAVGSRTALDVRPVPVTVAQEPAAGVVAGSRVDLWVTPPAQDGVASGPHLLAEQLEVAEVTRPSGAFSVGGKITVQVLVPTGSMPEVLGALAGESIVQVVLVPGAGG